MKAKYLADVTASVNTIMRKKNTKNIEKKSYKLKHEWNIL